MMTFAGFFIAGLQNEILFPNLWEGISLCSLPSPSSIFADFGKAECATKAEKPPIL